LRQFFNELIGKGREGSAANHHPDGGKLFVNQPGIRKVIPDIRVIAVQIPQALEGGHYSLQRIAGVIKIKGVFERGIAFMRGKNLNIPPRKTDQLRLKPLRRFTQFFLALMRRK
jgi:hypothetical protein